YLHFRGGFRIQQEQDPVQEPQRVLGEFVRVDAGHRQPAFAAAPDHLVGDDFDGEPDTFAQVLGYPDRVFDGIFHNPGPPDVPVGVRFQGLRAEDRGCPVDLSAAGFVFAFGDHEEVDGEVAAFGPAFGFGEEVPL